MKTLNLSILLLIINFTSYTQADTTGTAKIKKIHLGPLFKSDDTLNFTVFANLKPLIKDRGDTPNNHWGIVKYSDSTGKQVELPIKIKVRGNFRRMAANCSFPPFLLDFDKKKKEKSIFKQQNKLKLVTHCLKNDYIMQEYLVYKIYNLITENSFKARIAHVTYLDSASKRDTETRLAFLIEDDDDLAKRIKAKAYKKVRLRHNQVDSLQMATVSVFEYLIGNTDWSVPFRHNIKLYYKEGQMPTPIPYDFDHSGIVNASYATPAPELEQITSVKQRLYRGFAYSPSIFKSVFDNFKNVKTDIYKLYTGNKSFEPSYIKYVTKYLDDFYKIIDNKRDVENYIVGQGLKNMEAGGVQIKGYK
jgi:hypothetical protein